MIRNRLKELMVKRGLKASRVANDIENLSRNTINSTVNNKGKMLQLETINSLCQYLGVSPNEFFEYLPFDVEISINSDNELIANYPDGDEIVSGVIKPFYLNLYIKKISTNQVSGTTSKTFELSVISEKPIRIDLNGNNNLESIDDANFVVVLGNPPVSKEYDKQKEDFLEFWNDELTTSFQKDIRQQIISEISKYTVNEIQNKLSLVDWEKFRGTVNFRFDEAFADESKLTAGPVAEFETLNLPF